MSNVYIGFDNGISGSVGVIDTNGAQFRLMKDFTKMEQNYTKKRGMITRVECVKLIAFLEQWEGENVKIFIERPMVNPTRFQTTISAVRCLEAVLQSIEILGFHKQYIDSREWQKPLLPNGTKGPACLKSASKEIGLRLWPEFGALFTKQGDADGMMIAEWCRRFHAL